MYDWQISERVLALKSEIADLLETDEVYKKKRKNSSSEGYEHVRRMERVQRILEELNDLSRENTRQAGRRVHRAAQTVLRTARSKHRN